MSKEKVVKNSDHQKKVMSLSQEVLCACNGSKCEGICRTTHLQNGRTGICISAYNKPKPRFIRSERTEDEGYTGIFGDF